MSMCSSNISYKSYFKYSIIAQCTFPPFFTVTPQDIDECLTKVDSCAQNAVCVNTEGSYTCMCATGYTEDGFNNCISIYSDVAYVTCV